MMSTAVARTGRQQQRYEDQLRLVAGCIPFRFEQNVEEHGDLKHRLSVLMISSPNRDDLVFPKGGWENDEGLGEAASREAMEEAGIKGILGQKPLGVWKFRSKSTQNSCSLKGGCKGYLFALEVTEELDSWPEKTHRYRKWLTPEEAFKLCRYDWMREALNRLMVLVSLWDDENKVTEEEFVEHPLLPSPESGAECQILPGRCYGIGKSSGAQQLEESCKENGVQGR